MAVDIAAAPVASPFTEPAPPERLQAVARALEANGFITRLVDTAEDAKQAVLDLIPVGSEVHTAASATLETLGLLAEFESGRYDPVRPKYFKLDRATQKPEIRSSARRRSEPAPSSWSLAPRGSSPIWLRPSGESRSTACRRRTNAPCSSTGITPASASCWS